jgi:hypothetical protein
VRRYDDTIDPPKDNASNFPNRETSKNSFENGPIDPSSETPHFVSNAGTSTSAGYTIRLTEKFQSNASSNSNNYSLKIGKSRENGNESNMIAQAKDSPELEGNHRAGDISTASHEDFNPYQSSSKTKLLDSSPLLQDTLYSNSTTKDTYFYQHDQENTDDANTGEKEIDQEYQW